MTTCIVCKEKFGSCTCNFNPYEKVLFLFKGFEIINPYVSECGREYVDPYEYYGEAYINWRLSDENIM